MIDLLKTNLIDYYNITSPINLNYKLIGNQSFDLDDSDSFLLNQGKGKASFSNQSGDLTIIGYEDFIKQCKRPQSFSRGRKRCDFLLYHNDENGVFMLNEITSAYGEEEKLSIPIHSGKQHYEGGKNEKVVDQFTQSLDTLLAVPEIQTKIMCYSKRICLMSYKVIPYNIDPIISKVLSSVYSHQKIESLETQENGAIIPMESINKRGFEYRRISHDYSFQL